MFSDSWYTDRFMIMQITQLVDSLLQILKWKTKAELILLTCQQNTSLRKKHKILNVILDPAYVYLSN